MKAARSPSVGDIFGECASGTKAPAARRSRSANGVATSPQDWRLAHEDNLSFLDGLPDASIKLVVTSPPYNVGKSYERKSPLASYLEDQREVIARCVRLLHPQGSICWQVGNYVDRGEIVPLDAVLYPIFKEHGLKLRNRIVWHFGHGLHCKKRLSGRYETINWFTKGDDYTFHLDPIRVPSKYPGKRHFKGRTPASSPAIRRARTPATCGCFRT